MFLRTRLDMVEYGDGDAPLALAADAPVAAALRHGRDAPLAGARDPFHCLDRRQCRFPARRYRLVTTLLRIRKSYTKFKQVVGLHLDCRPSLPDGAGSAACAAACASITHACQCY